MFEGGLCFLDHFGSDAGVGFRFFAESLELSGHHLDHLGVGEG